jgi:xylose dehydrogenase (NAD/NADP)
MSKKIHWGLLSTARINRAVIAPLRISSRNELLAVASRSLENAKAYAKEWKIPQAYGSYEELLADREIDVVYVSLPNNLHAEWAMRAARAGKHVLCEKPLALTTAEVDAVAEVARQKGVIIAEAFMYRHHPQTLRVQELVKSGAIGAIKIIRGSFTFNLDRPEDIRLKPENGGGGLWDIGCYPVSYARILAGGQPESVFGWQQMTPSGVDETFVGQLKFPGGVLAQINCSFAIPYFTSVEVFGTEGMISIPDPFKPEKPSKITIRQGEREKNEAFSAKHLYLGEIEDMADAILTGKPPRIGLEDSRQNVATLVALYESARRQQSVTP